MRWRTGQGKGDWEQAKPSSRAKGGQAEDRPSGTRADNLQVHLVDVNKVTAVRLARCDASCVFPGASPSAWDR